MSFFQVYSYQYEDNPHAIGKIAVAFKFTIIPNGNEKAIFSSRVIFTLQTLAAIGKQFIGRAFLLDEDKPRFLRYAFNKLLYQLEESNLINKADIIVDHSEASLIQVVQPKFCELLKSHEEKLYCIGNPDKPLETSYKLCDDCSLPDPILFRCDNLRIETVSGINDGLGRYRLIPKYYCLNGEKLPSDLNQCSSLQCFIFYKFKIEDNISKPPLGFTLHH